MGSVWFKTCSVDTSHGSSAISSSVLQYQKQRCINGNNYCLWSHSVLYLTATTPKVKEHYTIHRTKTDIVHSSCTMFLEYRLLCWNYRTRMTFLYLYVTCVYIVIGFALRHSVRQSETVAIQRCRVFKIMSVGTFYRI